MSSQIGMVCALAGYPTAVQDIADEVLSRAEDRLRGRRDRNGEKGRMSRSQVDEAFGRQGFTTDLEAAAATADLVIEAAPAGAPDRDRHRLSRQARPARRLERPADPPSCTVSERYERGDLGHKAGRGFYTYEDPS